MDARLIIDASPDRFPQSPPQPLVDLIDRARGVGGVIVHVAAEAAASEDEVGATHNGAGQDRFSHNGTEPDTDDAEAGDDVAAAQPQIDSVVGTREDELVLVSSVPDAFEGVDDLAEGLDDLGVDRIILAGSNGRGALEQSGYAALAIGFELVLVRDGLGEGTADPEAASGADWPAQLEAAGAVLKDGADVWLKM